MFHSHVIGLSCCENELIGAYYCKKDVSKISANFSNCNGVDFPKRIISKTFESVLKNNSSTIVFLYCDINQFKTLTISSPFINQEKFLIFSFSINWSRAIFYFLLTFSNEGCSSAALLHHVRKWSLRFVQEVVTYVWKIR